MEYEPCLPVISILTGRPGRLREAVPALAEEWDSFCLSAPFHLFDDTRYYEDEMTYPLLRWWGYRPTLANPSALIRWKKCCNRIEDRFREVNGNRTVNIDPGYLNYGRLVLASNKYDLQKIYLRDGVYADPVLAYDHGDFQPFPWSFPDFKDDRYYSTLSGFREHYRELRNQAGD